MAQERRGVGPVCRRGRRALRVTRRVSYRVPPRLRGSVRLMSIARNALRVKIKARLCRVRGNSFTLMFPRLVRRCRMFGDRSYGTVCTLTSPLLTPDCAGRLRRFYPMGPMVLTRRMRPSMGCTLQDVLICPTTSRKRILRRTFVRVVLTHALPLFRVVSGDDIKDGSVVCRAISCVTTRCARRLALSGVTRSLKVDRSSLSHIFSNAFRAGFGQCLGRTELSCTYDLLLRDSRAVLSVYVQAKFSDREAFGHMFRRQCRVSPERCQGRPRWTTLSVLAIVGLSRVPSSGLPRCPRVPAICVQSVGTFYFLGGRIPISRSPLLLRRILLVQLTSLSVRGATPTCRLRFRLSSPSIRGRCPIPVH